MLQAGRSRVRVPMRSLDFFNLPNLVLLGLRTQPDLNRYICDAGRRKTFVSLTMLSGSGAGRLPRRNLIFVHGIQKILSECLIRQYT
jgi:hypothetical protein